MKDFMKVLFEAALNKDAQILKGNQVPGSDFLQIDGKNVVFLSVSDNKSRAYVIKGKGSTATEAVTEALEKYLANRPFKFKPKHLKLDILNKVTPINKERPFSLKDSKIIYNKGVNGLAFDQNFETALSPQEVEAYDVVEKNKLVPDHLRAAFNNQLPQSDTDLFNQSELENVYKFTAESYYTNGSDVEELYRGHRVINTLSKEDLLQAIELTKDNYFQKVVNDKGKFIYTYNPATDVKENKYNILRHAGTAYSMLETYELMPDESLMDNVESALEFLADKVSPVEVNGKSAQVLVERDVNKLGGNALAIVAFAKYTELKKDEKYLPIMQGLAVWIKETQKDNGDFSIHKQIFSTKEITDFRSNFYTGEAILGLVRLYELDRNEEWLDVAEKATEYLVTVPNKGATLETVHHDHWLLYGINAIYKYRPRDIFLDHAKLMAESIVSSQFLGEDYEEEWQGGLPPQEGKTPKSVPVACKTEGITNVYQLAKLTGDDELSEKIKETVKQTVKFELQMQLTPEKVMYFEKKKLCLGAFHNKFRAIELRNDFTQHNISSCIALVKILDSQKN
ncbi:hypothetical protein K8O68_09245 [Salipaludibacillus sp. CUR1]|uniref:hypothetical protein n=1 Tax=Salipaludibacillus sp. CUR1 TaxID=2820003 RepID=UPI001E2E673D|nr:hypothetical protein [Salipaludibacillus sp. CUR1]MCE7792602.1 hypothetical protein [Salipaludibacillus sp. CUR1]